MEVDNALDLSLFRRKRITFSRSLLRSGFEPVAQGEWLEEMRVNFDGDFCYADVTIACSAETDGQATTWTVKSSGSGGASTSETLPF